METLELSRSVAFKNILLATDFSEASAKTIPYAAAIASRYGSKVYLVHVIPPEPKLGIPLEPLPPELDRDRSDSALAMKTLASADPLKEIPHEVLLEEGPIRDVLSELIRRNEIDLLVLGTHGRGGLKKVILGSVAEELFRQAPCPVLTIGPAVPVAPAGATELRRILFATDFGAASLHALPYAVSLATESEARLILLHVLAPMPVVDVGPYWYPGTDLVQQQEKARVKGIEQLRKLIPPEADLPTDPEFFVALDFVPDGILRIAAGCQADLIVMGVNRAASARASAHLPWAIAHEVVCHAKCPVLTVRG